MRKQYEAPKAEKVEFDYNEMVTDSFTQKKENKCGCNETVKYFHNCWGCCK